MKLKTLALFLFTVSTSINALAQNWPAQPIKIVVPFTAGGITDELARSVGDSLSKNLGVPVVYEYRPGVSGIIGANIVAKSKPDGYTFLLTSNSLATSSILIPNLPFKVFEDFTPISVLTKSPVVVVTNSAHNFSSFSDLIRYAKNNPGKINYATSGIGSITHLAMEKSQQQGNFKMTHIPYKGQSEIWTDFLGGRLDAVIDTPAGITKYLHYENVKVLGVGASDRIKSMPMSPTLAESGLPNFTAYGGFLMLGPRGLPDNITHEISKNISAIVKSSSFKNKFEPLGMISNGSTPKEAEDFLKEEFVTWQDVTLKMSRQ